MRHRNTTTKLGREKAPREALIKALCNALILHGKMRTTLTKAKTVRPLVEKMVTLGDKASLAQIRNLRKNLSSQALRHLLKTVSPKYAERKGGYLRIVRLGNRKGDNAEEVIIEFV
jgi:large subunit ribosomal protein L17